MPPRARGDKRKTQPVEESPVAKRRGSRGESSSKKQQKKIEDAFSHPPEKKRGARSKATATTSPVKEVEEVKVATKSSAEASEDKDEVDVKEFDRMLAWLNKLKSKLGGSPNFPRTVPSFTKKITRREYVEQYSDYEFAYLQIVGFKAIHLNSAEIQALNNGQFFTRNPGTQLLERVGGMTMHGDRAGASAVVAAAPLTLLRAFRVAQKNGDNGVNFFTTAFERDADPCLEGRLSHLLQYIEESPSFQVEAGTESQEGVPWKDTCLDLRAKLDPQGLVGEYLRVFTNSRLAEFAAKEKLAYPAAKKDYQNGRLPKFESWCSRAAFREYLEGQGLGRPGKKEEGAISSLEPSQVEDIIRYYVELDSLSE